MDALTVARLVVMMVGSMDVMSVVHWVDLRVALTDATSVDTMDES
jgi:hypothetical protein